MKVKLLFVCVYAGLVNIGIIGSSSASGQCRQINPCACVFDDGSMVDLAPLSRNDGKPRFKNFTTTPTTDLFLWNPCSPFSILPRDSVCQDVAMCMVSEGNKIYDLGRQESASFHVDDNGSLKLLYRSVGDLERISEIELRCLPSSHYDSFTIEKIVDDSNKTMRYVMVLASKFACLYGPQTARTIQTTIVPAPTGQCTKISSCSCVYDDGAIVDLSSLSRDDGKPYFANATNQARNEYYSWNPCTPFSYIPINNYTECQNVAVCMIRDGIPNTLFYDIGNQDTAEFMVDSNGTLKLTYTSNQGYFKRVSEISLQCMATSIFDFFVVEGEQPENNNTVLYTLLLASKHACPYVPVIHSTTIAAGTSAPIYPTSKSPEHPTSRSSDYSTSTSREYSDITSQGHTYITTTNSKDDSTSQKCSTFTILIITFICTYTHLHG